MPKPSSHTSPSTSHTIRIIGGSHRRRTLTVPAVEGVRPTPDRVRETLFNWLGQTLQGWHVIDVFAGSGILSFEARSRGAENVIAIERHPLAMRHIRDTAERLNLPLQCIEGDALGACRRLAEQSPQSVDLILLDPPFNEAEKWLEQLLPLAECLLKPEGWLYLELPQPVEPAAPWNAYRSAIAGQVCYHLWRRTSD